jgi:hypothetical protein
LSINVYWSFLGDSWIRAEKPDPLFRRLTKSKHDVSSTDISNMFKCPSTVDWLRNTYALKFPYDYEIQRGYEKIFSTYHDQEFFNKTFKIRDFGAGLVGFTIPYVFFTDEDSLKLTVQMPPFLENTDFSKSIHAIPGTVDIGKWFRALDFAFFLNDDCTKISLNENDAYSYIKFDTDEKINFKKFIPTEKIFNYGKSTSKSTYGLVPNKRKLSDFYKTFNFKKHVLSEIKNNLID